MAYFPRETRDEARGRTAVAAARAQGIGALDAALKGIDAQFSPAGVFNKKKIDVERLIRKSFGHPEVRARFSGYIGRFVEGELTLDEACTLLKLDCSIKRPGEHIRLPSMVRGELHMILRLMRRKGMHAEFAETVAGLRAPVFAEAAE